jgi:uncharacterized membrane protein YdjX (TVP38/TMEM64 family)
LARHIALLILLVLLAAGAWRAFGPTSVHVDSVDQMVRQAGAWGPALFVVLLSLGNGLGAPGFLFLLPAVALWPPWETFVLMWLGSVGAGLVGYAFARGFGRRFVESKLPRPLRSFDGYLGTRAVRNVAFLRATLYLATPVHWGLGLSSVPLRPLLIGSILGFAVPSALWAFAGNGVFDGIRRGERGAWLALVVLVGGAIALPAWLARRRAGPPPPPDL